MLSQPTPPIIVSQVVERGESLTSLGIVRRDDVIEELLNDGLYILLLF